MKCNFTAKLYSSVDVSGISIMFVQGGKRSQDENKMIIMYSLQSFVTGISFSVNSKENEAQSVSMAVEK